MQLPRAEFVRISPEKLRDYLLSPTHLTGRWKARFFESLGFTAESWEVLETALREHACQNPAVLSKEDIYGIHYRVDGPLQDPSGKCPMVRSVWMVERGSIDPIFITAYPSR